MLHHRNYPVMFNSSKNFRELRLPLNIVLLRRPCGTKCPNWPSQKLKRDVKSNSLCYITNGNTTSIKVIIASS